MSPAIPYATLANLRQGSSRAVVDVACPICGPTKRGPSSRRKVLRTWATPSGLSFCCARCGVHGHAVTDERVTSSPRPHVAPQPDEDDERKRRNAESAATIWSESVAIRGTPGEHYLARRGIVLDDVPDHGGLRFHPRCPWGSSTKPCVIARFTDAVTAEPRGIWRRPINGDPPRSLGPMGGCVIKLWLDEDVAQGLVIGEGVETTLAAATRITHRATMLRPAWASGSAGNVESFPVLAGIASITLLVDNDASGRGQQAAERCAIRWVNAEREAILLTPDDIGLDFNDIIR